MSRFAWTDADVEWETDPTKALAAADLTAGGALVPSPHAKGTVQVLLPPPAAAIIREWVLANLDPVDVVEEELTPHVTVRYGFDPEVTVEQVAACLAGLNISVTKEWSEGDHPREPAGSESGGEFTSGGGGAPAPPKPKPSDRRAWNAAHAQVLASPTAENYAAFRTLHERLYGTSSLAGPDDRQGFPLAWAAEAAYNAAAHPTPEVPVVPDDPKGQGTKLPVITYTKAAEFPRGWWYSTTDQVFYEISRDGGPGDHMGVIGAYSETRPVTLDMALRARSWRELERMSKEHAQGMKAVTKSPAPFQLLISGLGIFEGVEDGTRDVLVAWVADTDGTLTRLHEALATLPHEDTHDTYRPHVTLAYLDLGAGEAVLDSLTETPHLVIDVDHLEWRGEDGTRAPLPLTGGPMPLTDAAGIATKEWDESAHPREPDGSPEGGRFTEGGGGGSASGPAADPRASYRVTTVEEAFARLSEGQKIILAKPRMVSTLLDKLATEAAKARESGGKGLVINLCDVSVEGSNIFCAENVGYSRVQMPQLSGKPLPGSTADALPKNKKGEVDLGALFASHLEQTLGIDVTEETIQAKHLKASQNELDGEKVAGMMRAMELGQIRPAPIFVTSDDYVVDGHHRWAAKLGRDLRSSLDLDAPMPISKIHSTILEVLVQANLFATKMGIPPAAMNPNKKTMKQWWAEQVQRLADRAVGKEWDEARARIALAVSSGMKAWDESQHPRTPEGSSEGGQFTEGGGGAWPAVQGGSASKILGRTATQQEDAAYGYFKSDVEALIATRSEAEALTTRWHNSETARLAFVTEFDKPGQTFKALIKVADVAVRAALPAEMVARWEQMGQVRRDYSDREMVAWARENVMTVPPSSVGRAIDMESVARNPGALLTQLAGRLTPIALESEEGRSLVAATLATWHKSHNGLRVRITSLYKFPEAPAPSVDGRGAPNIKRLFHGTTGTGALAIAAKGFSNTALTVNHGQMLGNGFYLAEHFSKSAQYIKGFLADKGEGYVMAFDVALGKVLRSGAANHDYKILSVNHGLSDEWPRYDSVKAMPHRSNGLVMTEYMIRNERASRQAVPRYLIGATVSD